MASTINATTTGSGGLITTGNSVNQLELQTGDTTRLVIDSSGNVTIQGQGDLRLADSDSSHYVALQAPGTVASNVTFTLPSADGTNGQVLQTNGSGTLSFATPAGGSWTYLSAVTASNSATVDIETTIDSTYDVYVIVGTAIKPDTDSSALQSRVKVSGSYQETANYYYHQSRQASDSTSYLASTGTADTNFQLFAGVGSTQSRSCNFYFYLFSPANTGVRHCVSYTGTMINDSGVMRMLTGGGYYNSTTAVTGVRFYFATGNVSSGTFRLYGIKNS